MRRSTAPIEPLWKERRLALSPDEAFRLFTTEMGRWWPMATHSIGGDDATDVRFESQVGGRVVEITAAEREYSWADVMTWDPPHRVVLSWHPTVEPVAASTIDVRFEALPEGTLLRLEHRDWEEYGARLGAELRSGYEPGWDEVLGAFEARAGEARRGVHGGP